MKLIGASIMLPCDTTWEVVQHGGVVLESGVITEVGNFEELRQKYHNCDFAFYKNHVLLPAFINAHIHFEFSKNDTSFCYGDFDIWLNSVMANRGEVLRNNTQAMQQAIKTQKRSGVGSVCAISSYDLDLALLKDSGLKVVYCHEVLGAREEDFTQQALHISKRLEQTLAMQSPTFIPALALHAPYSINPKIANYVVELAMRYNLILSTHFLESRQELEWLMNGSGYFQEFYRKNFGQTDPKPHFSIEKFLDMLGDIHTLFTHCLHADSAIMQRLQQLGSIVSCPRSNLLLQGMMGQNHIIATDGKSSNADIDLLEEVRAAFFATLASRGQQEGMNYCNGGRIHETKDCATNPMQSQDSLHAEYMPNSRESSIDSHHTTNIYNNMNQSITQSQSDKLSQSISQNHNIQQSQSIQQSQGVTQSQSDKLSQSVSQNNMEQLAQDLIYAITRNPANALRLNNGSLAQGKSGDIALFKLPFHRLDNIASSFILHAKNATRVLVNGNDIL